MNSQADYQRGECNVIVVEEHRALFANGECFRLTIAGVDEGSLMLRLSEDSNPTARLAQEARGRGPTAERTEVFCRWVDSIVQSYVTRHQLTLQGWRTFDVQRGWQTVTLSPQEAAREQR